MSSKIKMIKNWKKLDLKKITRKKKYSELWSCFQRPVVPRKNLSEKKQKKINNICIQSIGNVNSQKNGLENFVHQSANHILPPTSARFRCPFLCSIVECPPWSYILAADLLDHHHSFVPDQPAGAEPSSRLHSPALGVDPEVPDEATPWSKGCSRQVPYLC